MAAAASAAAGERWTFTQPSPLGDVSASYELTDEGLRYRADAPLAPRDELLRWDDIVEGATTQAELPAGKGGPDMVRWMPGHIEWLLLQRRGQGARSLMQPLPANEMRNAIVAGVRRRLGERWIGERIAFDEASRRFRLSRSGDGLKVAALVLAVLALLLLVLLVVIFLALPAALLFGAWCCWRGLRGLRGLREVASVPPTPINRAVSGPVKIAGRAVIERPSSAAASGRPCVWWDVAVDVRSERTDDDDDGWQQVMARHGGAAGELLIDDGTGRVPVWLRDAELLLQQHCWESGRDTLPAPGVALLAGTAFAWHGGKRLRVRETRIEADAPLVIVGTLAEAGRLPAADDEHALARGLRTLRTGAWRAPLLRALPSPLRAPVAVTIGYLDLLFGVGRGGERVQAPQDAPPPALDPTARLIWKGQAGRALIVSDRDETAALAQWRQRSWWWLVIGAAVIALCVHDLVAA